MSYDLVISDAHTHPDDDFRRFDWLGQMILEERPRSVICMGDLGCVDSLSRHGDTPKHTLADDIRAMQEAQYRIFRPLNHWNERQRSHRHAPYRMRLVMIEGNHEQRRDRVQKEDTHGYASVVDFDNLYNFKAYWDETYPYGSIVDVHGCYYAHAILSQMGRPLALSTVAKHTSGHTFVGHTHSLQLITTPVPGGVRTAMSVPAFMPEGWKPAYAQNILDGWSRGLLRVRPHGCDVAPGIDIVGMKQLEEMYG